jgi:hypothetical protein
MSGTGTDIKPEGGRRRSLKVKTLRRMLKKKGKKATGKKATLMKRLHMRGGEAVGEDCMVDGKPGKYESDEGGNVVCKATPAMEEEGGRRRRSRRRHRREEGGRRRSRRHSRPMGVIF